MSQIAFDKPDKAKGLSLPTLVSTLSRHWDWVLLVLSFLVAFRPLLRMLPNLWFASDTYYAHGALVPVCAGIVVMERWPKLRALPVRGSGWGILFLAPVLYVAWLAAQTSQAALQAALFLATLAGGVLFVAGRAWLKGLAAPLAFLGFGLPLFDGFVDANTLTAQSLSTDVAYWILQVSGLDPHRLNPSLIVLNHFQLDIGIPCSGMKILLAVAAFSVFFVLVAGLKPWRNVLLLASALPLALGVNALRIALIGVVGNAWGEAAGHQFHDYSGYLSLFLCLGLQYGLTRALGWK